MSLIPQFFKPLFRRDDGKVNPVGFIVVVDRSKDRLWLLELDV
jgi:hypothetical protein